jgi:oligopeptidase B
MVVKLSPPVPKRIPTTIATIHGDEIVNDYEWLRDPDDPDLLAYLEAENR